MFNRNNQRVDITDDAFVHSAGQFVQVDKRVANSYFPGSYQKPTNFLQATNAYAPRQMQFALRLTF
jgi:hypothetical protein